MLDDSLMGLQLDVMLGVKPAENRRVSVATAWKARVPPPLWMALLPSCHGLVSSAVPLCQATLSWSQPMRD